MLLQARCFLHAILINSACTRGKERERPRERKPSYYGANEKIAQDGGIALTKHITTRVKTSKRCVLRMRRNISRSTLKIPRLAVRTLNQNEQRIPLFLPSEIPSPPPPESPPCRPPRALVACIPQHDSRMSTRLRAGTVGSVCAPRQRVGFARL